MKVKWVCKLFYKLEPIELYKIVQHREKIFVVEQNEVYLDADDKDIQAWHLFGLNEKDELVAYARIIPPSENNPNLTFGRVSVAIEYRRNNLANEIVQQIFSNINNREYNQLRIQISAQTYLINFYRKLGFECFGEVYHEGKIPHIKMIRPSLKELPQISNNDIIQNNTSNDYDILDTYSLRTVSRRL